MLIEFFGRNYASFRDDFHLSLLAADIEPSSDRGIIRVPLEGEEEPLRLLRCAAIYGPNAAGKSNILRAAQTMARLIAESGKLTSDDKLPGYEPFRLDPQTAKSPTMLGLRAVVERRVYEYSFDFTDTSITKERLIRIGPAGEETLIDRGGETARDVNISWSSPKHHGRVAKIVASGARRNALILSLLDQVFPELAQGLAVSFRRLLRFQDMCKSPTDRPSKDAMALFEDATASELREWLLRWLVDADLGIVDYQLHESDRDLAKYVISFDETLRRIRPLHTDTHTLRLSHAAAGSTVELEYSRESLGTRRLLELLPIVYRLTHSEWPTATFIDEIDASMHPILLNAIVRHFNVDVRPEDLTGQLVFATHETGLFDAPAKDTTLRRDQVYFVEKDTAGATEIYSLVEFKERNVNNLRRRYLQGRYGALPMPGPLPE